MNVNDRPHPVPAVESVDIGVETLVYDGHSLHLFIGSAAGIWRRADGRLSAAEIAAEVAEDTAAPAAEVSGDVVDFLAQLLELGLLATDGSADGLFRPSYVGYVLDGDQALIVDLRDGRRLALNATGARVWDLICRHCGPATVLQLLRAEYPEAPSSLEAEVSALIDELCTAGLLLTTPNSPGLPS